jgi:hypothetical protein
MAATIGGMVRTDRVFEAMNTSTGDSLFAEVSSACEGGSTGGEQSLIFQGGTQRQTLIYCT